MADPDGSGGTEILTTVDQALQKIKEASLLDGDAPKIVYLEGWQYEGHDSGYPSWDEVNPALKRPEDATAADSINWLIGAAQAYNTVVSLHINMKDAYNDGTVVEDPLYSVYGPSGADLLDRCAGTDPNSDDTTSACEQNSESAGALELADVSYSGARDGYWVNFTREWQSGYAQSRINDLLAEIPNLRESGTIHIDAYYPGSSGGPNNDLSTRYPDSYVIDTYHGTTYAQEEATQRQVFRYWRAQGMDVTSENLEQLGLQPAAWLLDGTNSVDGATTADVVMRPGSLVTLGESVVNRDSLPDGGLGNNGEGDGDEINFLQGASAHQEGNWDHWNFANLYSHDFALDTLPFLYLNTLTKSSFSGNKLTYSGGVVADASESSESEWNITQGGNYLRIGDDDFFPATWVTGHLEIMAYSDEGYATEDLTSRSWTLPSTWSAVTNVDVYQTSANGYIPVAQGLPVTSNQVTLDLTAGQLVVIVPSGTAMSPIAPQETDVAQAKFGASILTDNGSNLPANSSANAIDGSLFDAWIGTGPISPSYHATMTVDLGVERPITHITQVFADNDGASYSFTLEGSNNAPSGYQTIATYTDTPGNTFDTPVNGSFRYVRLTITGISETNDWNGTDFYENQDWPDSRELEVWSPDMNLSPAATFTSSTDNGNAANNAQDGSTATAWVASSGTMPQSLIVNLGAPRAVDAVEQLFNDGDAHSYSYEIDSSSNGTTWTPLTTRSTVSQHDHIEYLANDDGGGVTTGVMTQYLRLLITGSSGGGWASSQELRILGPAYVATSGTYSESGDNGNGVAQAHDGFWSTAWVAPSGSFSPAPYVEVTFGSTQKIVGIEQAFANEGDGSAYTYQIQTSQNGTTWNTLDSETATTATENTVSTIAATSTTRNAEYARLVVSGITNSHWANSLEFEVLE
ncbi:MAG TPA: discoidin domain-containing protein [Galbitalea sp.]|nr:discoidin domain-containing protein [Galbitalea sp.]